VGLVSSAPELRSLIDWIDGQLPEDQAAAVASAVAAGDHRTTATVRWLQGFVRTARAVPMHEPPPILRQRLSQDFEAWLAARAALERRPRIVPMTLIFDSRSDRELVGVRAATDDTAVHLAFRSDEADLMLDLFPQSDGRLRCEGQVLLADVDAASVFEATIEGPGFASRTVDGDVHGGFTIADVRTGATVLRASNGEVTVVAPLDLA